MEPSSFKFIPLIVKPFPMKTPPKVGIPSNSYSDKSKSLVKTTVLSTLQVFTLQDSAKPSKSSGLEI